jgi:uncharacterized peroxidase-related enzyme
MATVTPLEPSQASPDLKESVAKLVHHFGRVPNMYGVMAHQPAALKSFLPFYAAVMGGGSISRRHRELAFLKASILNGCPYCMQAHKRLATHTDITEEQIAALPHYQRSPLFDAQDKAVIRYAELVTRAAAIRDPDLQALRLLFSPEQIVDLTLVICLANFTNRFNNALRIVPDIG